jgi:hypothetical protein
MKMPGLLLVAGVLHIAIVILAGAFASARVARLKKTTAFATGILMSGLFGGLTLTIFRASRDAFVISQHISLAGILAWRLSMPFLALVGAFAAARMGERWVFLLRGRTLGRLAGPVLVYAGLFIGAATVLLLVLYPTERSSHDDLVATGGFTLCVSFLLVACFALRYTCGLRKGLVVNPVVWISVALVALFACLFVYRERMARPPSRAALADYARAFNERRYEPDRPNGMSLYRKAFQELELTAGLLKQLPEPAPWGFPTMADWRTKSCPEWEPVMEAQADALQYAIQAAQSDHFYAPLELIPEHDAPGAWLLWTHDCPNLLSIRRSLKAEIAHSGGSGDFDRTLECCDALYRMVRAVGKCPASRWGLQWGIEYATLP